MKTSIINGSEVSRLSVAIQVSWFAVIYQFSQEQILIAKPTPNAGATSCGTVMLRRGNELTAPNFKDLSVNTDDDSVVALLSRLLGIRENRTDVAIGHSRESFDANIKHTFYYLFQKQGLVANKDQLFYRQNEAFQPQAIRDTLPILLGISSNDRYELEAKLRTAQRDLKINTKRLEQACDTIDTSLLKGFGLLSEARAVGIITQDKDSIGTDEVINVLRSAMQWVPSPLPEALLNKSNFC